MNEPSLSELIIAKARYLADDLAQSKSDGTKLRLLVAALETAYNLGHKHGIDHAISMIGPAFDKTLEQFKAGEPT